MEACFLDPPSLHCWRLFRRLHLRQRVQPGFPLGATALWPELLGSRVDAWQAKGAGYGSGYGGDGIAKAELLGGFLVGEDALQSMAVESRGHQVQTR